jgi:hypothetical protein
MKIIGIIGDDGSLADALFHMPLVHSLKSGGLVLVPVSLPQVKDDKVITLEFVAGMSSEGDFLIARNFDDPKAVPASHAVSKNKGPKNPFPKKLDKNSGDRK